MEKTDPPARRFPRLKIAPTFSLWGLLKFGFLALFGFWLFANYHADRPVETLKSAWTFPDSKWIEVDGINVHYRVSGQGEPLLLLHGSGSSLHTWAGWTRSLSVDYQVISLDLPGFGLTGPSARGSYSAYAYVGFLKKFLDAIELKNFFLAGNSMGGQIAWFFAADHPERVKKLVLIDASGYPKDAAHPFSNWLARTPFLSEVVQKITPKSIFRNELEDVFANDSLVTDSLVNRHFELMLRTGNRKAFCDRARVSDNRPPVEFIKKVAVPTLILWGAEDTWIPTDHAYQFHKDIRKSILQIYEGIGHAPQEEAPELTANDVRLFFQGKL